jgi:hypothetical protein
VAQALRVLVVLMLCASPALADARHVTRALAAAEQAFDDQDYTKVVKTLRSALSDPAATRAQQLRGLELTALSQFILGDEAAARASFERLLDIDPGYQLRDASGSPRIADFFDAVKQDVVPGFEPDLVATLDHAAPPNASAGHRLEIDVRATAGADHVKEVVFRVRRRGEQDYATIDAGFRGDARWRIRYTPPSSSEGYTIEYYLEGRGLTGETVARVGGPDAPLSIAITPGASSSGKRWYRRWYVWAGIGALAVGTGAVILGTSGVGDGSLSPGRVTVSP